MGQSAVMITGPKELQLRRSLEEILHEACLKPGRYRAVMKALDCILAELQGREAPLARGPKETPPAKSLAEKARQWFEEWYHGIGFAIEVPMPWMNGKPISNREFRRRAELDIPQALFGRPATSLVSYETFVETVQPAHWTVGNAVDRAMIYFKPVSSFEWFWAEVSDDCPRLKTPLIQLINELTGPRKLISLEQYFVTWHAHKTRSGRMLDRRNRSCLCTRYNSASAGEEERLGALCALGYGGLVNVLRYGPGGLSRSFDYAGGRAVEVVQSAA